MQQGELAAGAGENVVNDAYLLSREAAADFRTRALDAVQGLPGVRIDVTGPWAPYSFAPRPVRRPRRRTGHHERRGAAARAEPLAQCQVTLIGLLDHLLSGDVVVTGDLVLSIADIDLVRIWLRAPIVSVSAQNPSPWTTRVCPEDAP